jgi:hypothetical protein
MRPWTALTAGWQIARWTATAIVKSPGNYVDLYYRDRYVVVSKRAVLMCVVVVILVPLAFAISLLVRAFSR